MKKLASIGVVLLILALNAAAQNDWKGSYYFGEDGGKNAGGTNMFIEHTLEISSIDRGSAA